MADMREWKAQGITEQLLHWSKRNMYENLFGAQAGGGVSQPPMLIALYGKTSELPEKWHARHFGWKRSRVCVCVCVCV